MKDILKTYFLLFLNINATYNQKIKNAQEINTLKAENYDILKNIIVKIQDLTKRINFTTELSIRLVEEIKNFFQNSKDYNQDFKAEKIEKIKKITKIALGEDVEISSRNAVLLLKYEQGVKKYNENQNTMEQISNQCNNSYKNTTIKDDLNKILTTDNIVCINNNINIEHYKPQINNYINNKDYQEKINDHELFYKEYLESQEKEREAKKNLSTAYENFIKIIKIKNT